MKRQLMTVCLAVGSIGLLGTSLDAQQYRITTKVPFAFAVGDRTCPAGAYDLQASSYSDFEMLHNASGKCSLFVSGKRALAEPAGRPRLVFHRIGQNYFLSKIWNGKGTGSTLPLSRREKQLQEAAVPSEVATLTVDLVTGQ